MAVRTIGTELVLSGEKEFNDAMKGVNSNLKNLRSDMAATTAEFADNASSMDALTAKQKVLQETVEQHQAKVEALRGRYEEMQKTYGENSAQADKYRQQLNNATAALHKETQALQKNEAALNAAQKSEKQYIPITQRMADSVKAAGNKVQGFSSDVAYAAHNVPVLAELLDVAKVSAKGFGTAMSAAGTGAKAIGSGVAGVGKVVGGVSAAAAAGVAAIGAGGVAVLGAMAGMAREAAEAAKAAQEAGEPLTEAQQRWLSFSGQLDALSGSASNAKSAIAEIILPMLDDLSLEGGAFLDSFVQEMSAAAGNTEKQTEILGRYIADGAKLIIQKLPEYLKAGKEILGGIVSGFSENSDDLLDTGLNLVLDLLRFIMENAPALADAGISLVMQLIEGIDGEDLADTASEMVGKIVTGLAQAAPKLIPAAVKLIMELVVGLGKNAPMLLKSGGDLIVAIIDGILSGLGEIGKAAREILDVWISEMRNSKSEVLQFGADVVQWIADAILGAWDGLVSWFNGLWDSLFSGRDVDVNVNGNASSGNIDGSHASGLRYVPFDGYLAQLHRGEAVLPAAEADAYRAGKTAGDKNFNLTVYAQSLSQSDMDMLVDYFNRKVGEDL